MKKRILALALAGTTAFSVFGAAISANAAVSTDVAYDVDAYMSYTSVAHTITAKAGTVDEAAKYTYWDTTSNPYEQIASGSTQQTEAQLAQWFAERKNVKEEYNTKTTYTYIDKAIVYQQVGVDGVYISEYDYTNKTGAYVPTAQYVQTRDPKNFTTYTLTITQDNLTTNPDTITLKSVVTSNGSAQPATDAVIGTTSVAGSITVTNLDLQGDGNTTSETYANLAALQAQLEKITTEKNTDVAYVAKSDDSYISYNGYQVQVNTQGVGSTPLTQKEYDALQSLAYYRGKVQIQTTDATYHSDAALVVNTTKTNDPNSVVSSENNLADWSFNSDMTGEATVSPYMVSTQVVNGKLESKKVSVPTVYAYDYLYFNSMPSTAATIGYHWNRKDLTNTVASFGAVAGGNAVHLGAETGRGNADRGIRYEVVSEWIDFLDELAINHDNGYRETEAEFVSNYTDMFYSDPVYSIYTGQLVDYNSVDLYNISKLLSDIYDHSAQYANPGVGVDAGWNNANTSELIYLMQQYNKYIGNYIDKSEVSTSEWGELMLSVLNAATEDNFKNARDYKKYVNRVEDLQDAYEMATTVAQVNKAEEGMYELLTSIPYTSTSVDKTELGATIEGLYFNVGTAPVQYTTAPSTQSNNVDYSNYNYFIAVAQKTGNDYVFTTTLAKGYYSLYPMLDYYDASNKVAVYSGNVDANKDFAGAYATDEYEWFWNVYQLAANMNKSNKYQGSVDAINEALNEAVANLAVTTTPYATETSAKDEMVTEYEGKIESDYNTGYYGKYTQANDYAANVAEGKWQTRIARYIVGVAGEALTYQGTQVTVSKNDMKTVETAIKNGKTALEAIKADANYNAAQVNALNKAIAGAQAIVDLYNGTVTSTVNHNTTPLVGDKDQIVKSDLTAAIEAIDSAINYSEIVMGWSKTEAGKWQYGTEEGYLNDGWHKVDGGKTWFYFNADGTAKQSEWFQENGTWYWFNSNCGAATGWAKVDGSWYYFKGNNAMKTGWEKVDGNWYYMASSGKMVTGWCEVNGKWYYFSKESNSLGQMLYNTTVDGYKLGADGAWIK